MNTKKLSVPVFAFLLIMLTSCMLLPQVQEPLPAPPPEPHPPLQQEERFFGPFGFSFTGKLDIPGQAIDVDVQGTHAYLTDDLGQLHIIDFSDKKNPQIMGKARDMHAANIVIAKDAYAYVSYTSRQRETGRHFTECGFKIIDISSPESPRVVGGYISGSGTEKWVQGFSVQDDYAFLNSTEILDEGQISQMEIIDISDKNRPRLIAALEIEGVPWSMDVQGNYAYLNSTIYDAHKPLGQACRFFVVDITEKEKPQLAGSCHLAEGSAGVYVEGNFAYISSNTIDLEDNEAQSLLQVLDIADKNSPALLGRCSIPGQGWEIDKVSDYVLVSDLDGGVHAVDVSQKDNPRHIDSFYTTGTSYDIHIEGNYGYIADGFSGLTVLSLSEGEGLGDRIAQDSNRPPYAYFEIFGDQSGPKQYPAGVPVYFSGSPSYDVDGDLLSYRWEIGAKTFEGEEISHIFEAPGIYAVHLTVSDGTLSDHITKDMVIEEANVCVVPIQSTTLTVEIEYRMANLGPGTLQDIQCFARIPQTYAPFQTVKDIAVNRGHYQVHYDQSFNKILQIDYGDLTIQEAEGLSAVITLDVEMISFEYADIDYGSLRYHADDSDLLLYTVPDLYIDSDHPSIINKANSVIGDEKRPAAIIEKLYQDVTDLLDYDYRRADEPRYPLMYASEILREKTGVCADYAILYTALLRAAGIPSRIASGLPIYTIQLEGGQLNMGHAWTEVKFPQYGWVPMDITIEDRFMALDYNMNLATERGSGFLHRNMTMDWASYYYD